MSIEALVLVALILVLPLLQQLIQATRQRNQRPPESAVRQGPRVRTPPPAVAVPPLPEPLPDAASDAISADDPIPAADDIAAAPIAPTPHRVSGRNTTAGLRSRREIRRAIVLATILGRCRANQPYDGPEHA